MTCPVPIPPQSLSTLAREVLERLAKQPAAAEVVLGGGVALAHYLDYRTTHDLDAWWASGPTAVADRLLTDVMQAVATRHGLTLTKRCWGETASLELADGQRRVFSLQIATRDRWLDVPLVAAWPPVRIETLRDNVAAKMTALVERGAPRDLRDVHQLCLRGLVGVDECWDLYRRKNPDRSPRHAAAKVLHAVERLEMQRPLDTIEEEASRRDAEAVRRWYRDVFCRISA
jgi:hypothetical protein